MKFWKHVLKGFTSLTIWPERIKPKHPRYKTDEEAMAADWKAVGLDLEIAIAKVEDQIQLKQERYNG